MSGDNRLDPFGQPTTFEINPGGRVNRADTPLQQASAAESISIPPAQRVRDLRPMQLSGLVVPNGLSDLAPFLLLATRMRLGQITGDPVQLLQGVEREIARVFTALPTRGWDSREAQLAKFFVCCTTDNAALNSPIAPTWATRQLTGTFFKNAQGGQQLFTNLNAMLAAPPGARATMRLFELAYLCLVCGFEGRYGVAGAQRETDIEDLKKRILAVIGEGRVLAVPSFLGSGVPKQDAVMRRDWRLPVWPFAAFAACACIGLILVCRGLLANDASALLAKLEKGAAAPLPALTTASVPAQPPQAAWIERMRATAGSAGFTVDQKNGNTVTVVASGGLFASGSDKLKPELAPTFAKIGSLLNEVRGSVVVRGHTDQMPVSTLQFVSNKDLSRARAKAVGQVVQTALDDKTRVYIQALGDSELLCRESNAVCLDRNRRVEIVLDPGS
jgi:type VI secretion system protein ImpK